MRRGVNCATNRGQNGSELKPKRQTMKKKILYIGLDVLKKNIDAAITDERANGKVRSYSKIDGTLEALDKLIKNRASLRPYLRGLGAGNSPRLPGIYIIM